MILLLYVGIMSALVVAMSPGELRFSETLYFKVPTGYDLIQNTDTLAIAKEIRSLDQKIDSIDVAVQKKDSIPVVLLSRKNPKLIQADLSLTDTRIELPSLEQHPLQNFFDGLFQVQTTESLVHILHYGDSQLDGDRVTEYLRHRLQNQFGGCGVGLVPVTEAENIRSTLKQEASENWKRHAIYGVNEEAPRHNLYSLLGSYFWFSGNRPDGVLASQTSKAEISFQDALYGYDRNSKFEKLRVFYRNPIDKMVLKYSLGNDFGGIDSLSVSKQMNSFQLPLSGNLKNGVKFTFESKGSPEVFGVSFDCNTGVAVDNIAFRGSSGTEFIKMDRQQLKAQMKALNVRLIIVQFGVNVIPSVLNNYRFYENALYRQLSFLKSLSPDTDILVVGVSDMARKDGASFQTYPNVPLVQEAQRQASFRAGCAYWNLFEAMGGKNSIASWVNQQPPLAQKDYTHFTRRGAKLVGEMLYNELMRLYIPYLDGRIKQEKLTYDLQ